MGLLARKPGVAAEQFRRHWREVHGPLAARLPGLRRYQQNLVLEAQQLGAGSVPRGEWRLDGISDLWFDDLAAMRGALASEAYRAVADDEPNFAAGTRVIVTEQKVVVPLCGSDAAGPLAKCMVILARARGVDAAAFRRRWWEERAPPLARLPGLAGCTRNLVIERIAAGRPAGDDVVPVDEMAELWFRDTEALRAAFASGAARELEADARDLIGTIAAWRVDVHAVV